jgi:hypothetical protein
MAESSEPSKVSAEDRRSGADATPHRIYLVPYPKIVFLYPSFLAAIVIAVILTTTSEPTVGPNQTIPVVCALVFLGIMAVNLVVLSFDFPRGTSLTLFFCIAALVLGGVLLFVVKPEWWPEVGKALKYLRPAANAQFYYLVSALFAILFLSVLIIVQFDYWEVRPNELLHHHGILSDLKRFSAPNLRIDKEINDVFEYMLLGSGRLILQPSSERRAIILDNVLFISSKEQKLTKMLGSLQVRVHNEPN